MKQDIFYTVMSVVFILILLGFILLEKGDYQLRKELGVLKFEQHKGFVQRNGMAFLFGFLAYENYDNYFLSPMPFFIIAFVSFLVIALLFVMRGRQKKGLFENGFVCNKEIPWLWKDMASGLLIIGKSGRTEILWTPKNRRTWHQKIMRRPLLVVDATQLNFIQKICKAEKIQISE